MSGRKGAKWHREDQIRSIVDEALKERKEVNRFGELVQKYQISLGTLYRWMKKYGISEVQVPVKAWNDSVKRAAEIS